MTDSPSAALGKISPGMLGKVRPRGVTGLRTRSRASSSSLLVATSNGTSALSSKKKTLICSQPDLADSSQIHMLFGAPKVVLILHREPAFRGSSQRL